MGDFFRDYGTQLALAIAGINTIISLVIGQYFKDNPRWRIAFVIASVALIGLGVGASFYSQYQIEVSANVEKEKRIAMKDVLGAAINECAALNVKKRTESQEDVDAYANDAGELATKTRNLIAQAYGEGEANLFMNDAGIPGMASPGHPNVLMRSEMIARIQRLNELISRVDTITMRPGFDPRNYHPKQLAPQQRPVNYMAAIYNKGTMQDIEQILKFDGNPEVLAMMIEWQTVKQHDL